MTAGPDNGRTHEPSLRELTAELDGLRDLTSAQIEALRVVMDERDRLYKERDEARRTAVDAALSAAKEAVSAALTAADRAVAKAETANEKRFDAANEFRGQLADQAATFYPRREADIRFDALTEKVENLRVSRDTGAGERLGLSVAWQVGLAIFGLAVGLATILYAIHAVTGR